MKVRITTPCRLHFSLIDLNGSIGRIDGGLGVALNHPNTIIEAESSPKYKLEVINPNGYSYSDISQLTKTIIRSLQIKDNVKIKVDLGIPAHVGLGSKTQLSLAICQALCLLNGIEKKPYELALLTSRAGTSRIGLTAFEKGGFILDGGHSFGAGMEKNSFLPSSASKAPPAPILFWEPVPSDWFFVITLPHLLQGASGSKEIDIFQQKCPIPIEDVQKISHLILMKILPAIKQKQIEQFGQGIYELQQIGFKKIEINLQDKLISNLINFYLEKGAVGSGMSSFGPVSFALIKGYDNALQLQQEIENFLHKKCKADVKITNVNNKGAQVDII
ncbi:MAG: beta-ribofuranosylaminobenzene 5'-phosphate synthase [Candidatus Helarchaeota archaeon]